MVYIHGGAFIRGNGRSDYVAPRYILNKDIVFVTMNYRLGVFGFLSTGDAEAPGNFGLKDQLLALRWVKKNVKAFGGDPERITLVGQSAGSVSVNLHALSDASTGLCVLFSLVIRSFSAHVLHDFKNRTRIFKKNQDHWSSGSSWVFLDLLVEFKFTRSSCCM